MSTRYFLSVFSLVVLLGVNKASADIVNGGFENDFEGWTLTANNEGFLALAEAVENVGTVLPQEGNKMAQIKLGTNNDSKHVDFNFFHTSPTSISAGQRLQFKIKIPYNGLTQNKKVKVMEAIFQDPPAGQPLFATLSINPKTSKCIATNIISGERSETAIISDVSSGYNYQTEWILFDIDLSSLDGNTLPLSFFLKGGSYVPHTENIVYLIDDVKILN